jgi:hypothetical protein
MKVRGKEPVKDEEANECKDGAWEQWPAVNISLGGNLIFWNFGIDWGLIFWRGL